MVGGCGLPGKGCFQDPVRCGHWGFSVECVSGYQELYLVMEMGWGLC